MELMPVFSVQDMGEFLTTASLQGWSVLGTCSSTSKDGLEEADDKGVPVIHCSEYVIKEPTIIALGRCIKKTRKLMCAYA